MTIILDLKRNERGDHFFTAKGKDFEFICCRCDKNLNDGYICENNEKIILCKSCQDKFPMSRCKHDVRNEHRHIKFIRKKDD